MAETRPQNHQPADLCPVVQKPISANPGLKVDQGFYFPCLKMFAKANFKIEVKTSQSRN